MSIHVCKCERGGIIEFHLRYPGMTEAEAQNLADRINAGGLVAQPVADAVPDVGQMVYQGNSVSFIYDKMRAYRSAIGDVWEVLKSHGYPADGDTPVDAMVLRALAAPGATPAPAAVPNPIPKERLALNVRHPDCHKAADAFWAYWNENGETHKHGYYESTWGAINRALRVVGVVEHEYPAHGIGAPKGEA